MAAILPSGSALVELAEFKAFDFKSASWRQDHYLAFVIPAQNPQKTALVDLGPAEPIDLAVKDFKEAVMDTGDLKGRRSLIHSRKLYELVFAKLVPLLGQATDIFISPDANLNLIPFEIMAGPDGRYLIEHYSFNYLASGRDILRTDDASAGTGPPVLFGDPDYNLEKGGENRENQAGSDESEKKRSFERSRDMRGMFFFASSGHQG